VMTLPSHAGNGDAEATLVVARCRYRGDPAMVRCRCRVMLMTALSNHAGDGAATQGCTDYGKVAQPRARSIEVLSQREKVGLAC
jgi:hypothetical protein